MDGEDFYVNSISGDELSLVKSFSFMLWADCPGELADLQNETVCHVEGSIIGTDEKMEITYVLVLRKDDELQSRSYKRVGISEFDTPEDSFEYRDLLSSAKVKRVLLS